MLRCVSTTPFGSPELPLVKSKPASVRVANPSNLKRFATTWVGNSHAARSQGNIARLPPAAASSARQSHVCSGQGEIRELRAHRRGGYHGGDFAEAHAGLKRSA